MSQYRTLGCSCVASVSYDEAKYAAVEPLGFTPSSRLSRSRSCDYRYQTWLLPSMTMRGAEIRVLLGDGVYQLGLLNGQVHYAKIGAGCPAVGAEQWAGDGDCFVLSTGQPQSRYSRHHSGGARSTISGRPLCSTPSGPCTATALLRAACTAHRVFMFQGCYCI